jgi:hypothetical protein
MKIHHAIDTKMLSIAIIMASFNSSAFAETSTQSQQNVNYLIGSPSNVLVTLPADCPEGSSRSLLKIYGTFAERYLTTLDVSSSGAASVRVGFNCPPMALGGGECNPSNNTTTLSIQNQSGQLQFLVPPAGGVLGFALSPGQTINSPGRTSVRATNPILSIDGQLLEQLYSEPNEGMVDIEFQSFSNRSSHAELPGFALFSTSKMMNINLKLKLECAF